MGLMKSVKSAKEIEKPKKVFRKTLAYNDESMLCHFLLKKGAEIPLHNHKAVQTGYVIKGRAEFLAKEPKNNFIVEKGDSYVFDSFVEHGTVALEETEYIEVFVPSRDEFKDF